jgi:hypothetical protein
MVCEIGFGTTPFLRDPVVRCLRVVRIGRERPGQVISIGQLNARYCAIRLVDNTTTPHVHPFGATVRVFRISSTLYLTDTSH